MTRVVWTACAVLIAATAIAKEDPRLATAKTAFVVAKDDLGDDKPVAVSLADRLTKITPLAAAESKEQADLVLRIRAHIPGMVGRGLVSPTVWLEVQAPDGTVIYKGSRNLTRGQYGITDIPAGLADEAADMLRNAMRKARDGK